MTACAASAGGFDPATLVAEPAVFHGHHSGYGFFTVARLRKKSSNPIQLTVPGVTPRPASLWSQRYYHVKKAGEVLPASVGNVDTYISQATFQEFKNGRKISNLARVGAFWVDLDTYKVPELRGLSVDQLVGRFIDACENNGIARPSVIVDSGNGLYAKWLLDRPVPKAALARWKPVQNELCKRFADFNADPKACDAARVLRVVGSINSRTGRPVTVAWQNPHHFDQFGGYRPEGVPTMAYSFDTFADSILQESRERFREERVKRLAAKAAARQAGEKRNTNGLRTFSPRQLASDRYDDVQKLLRLRGWEDGAPEGQRDMPLFVSATCLALMHPLSELRKHIVDLAARIAPSWSDLQVRGCVHSVLDRAERSMLGKASVWNGYEVDPRYTPSNAWLIDALQITPDEERELKTIISAKEARRRDAARAAAKRRAAGACSRDEFIDAAQVRRAQAKQLRDQGLSWADVGVQLGISAGAARALGSRATVQRTRSSVSL